MVRRFLGAVLVALLACGWATGPALADSGQIQGAGAFRDIQGNFAYWDIVQLLNAGIVTIPKDGLFHPSTPVTRLQFAVWMARALHLVPPAHARTFADQDQIPQADRPLVSAVVAAGIMTGVGHGEFDPAGYLTRAQAATVFGRELESHGQTPDTRYFALWQDGASIPSWALPATIDMRDGLIYGLAEVGGRVCRPEACFAPDQETTRAQAAVLIVRYLAYFSAHFGGPALPQANAAKTAFLMGFWDSGTAEAYSNLVAHGDAINFLVDGGYDILPGGALSGFDNEQNIAWARQHPQAQLWMMVQSMSSAQNAFLSSPSEESAIVAGIAADVKRVGYVGVNLDVEGLPASEGSSYTAFVAQVAAALHAEGAKVSVDVPAPFEYGPGQPNVGAYDYQALGQVADQIDVMAYSVHWPGTAPGPIAPLAWEKSVIAFGSQWVPPAKLVLGLPAYGYIWNDSTLGATAYWVSGMLNEAGAHGATMLADPSAGENTFTYQHSGGTYTGWFVGGQGLAARLSLVRDAAWAGVIAWRLDYGVRDWWTPWQQAFAAYQ